jgi:hypothetical protein
VVAPPALQAPPYVPQRVTTGLAAALQKLPLSWFALLAVIDIALAAFIIRRRYRLSAARNHED